MTDQRTHGVTTSDNATIVGTVHGRGPPLVLLPGAFGDGDTAAARAFGDFVFLDEEIAALEAAGYFQATGRYVPNLLKTFQQAAEHAGRNTPVPPSASDPAVLGAISVPVLALHGSDTKPFWARFARHVTGHVPNARMHEVPGSGHAAPLTHAEELAGPLIDFFASTLRDPERVAQPTTRHPVRDPTPGDGR